MAGKKFSVNAGRYDPYKNFKFRVKWDGKYVAGLSKISGLKKTTEVVEWREGGDSSVIHKIPGRTSYEPITLETGVTHDTAFEEWANQVNNIQGDAKMSLKNFRKDIQIFLLNEQGTIALGFLVYRCWVSEYQALPDMDANSKGIAIAKITLQNEGWERDTSIAEPSET